MSALATDGGSDDNGIIQRSIGDAEPRVVPVFGDRTVDVLPVWLVAHAELRTSARIRRVYDALAEGLRV